MKRITKTRVLVLSAIAGLAFCNAQVQADENIYKNEGVPTGAAADIIEDYEISSSGQIIGGINADSHDLTLNDAVIRNNTVYSSNSIRGGLFYAENSSITGTVTDIIGNTVESTGKVDGGLLYSYGTKINLDSINGVIKNNTAKSLQYDSNGNIVGGGQVYGGVLNYVKVNGGNITEISGNTAEAWNYSCGAVMYGNNENTKFDTVSNVVDNHIHVHNGSIYGGIIYGASIGKLNGKINNNSSVAVRYDANGKPIGGDRVNGNVFYSTYINGGDVTEISDNYAEAWYDATGGAISGYGIYTKLDSVGNITNNHAVSHTSYASGGALKEGKIGQINGVIKNNYVRALKYDDNGNVIGGSSARGGALSDVTVNGGNVTEISGNYAEGWSDVSGGAITAQISYEDRKTIFDTVGDIKNNHAISYNSSGYGGALNYGTIGNLNGAIKNNYIKAKEYANGGAFYYVVVNGGNVTEISGNYADGESSANGGAIFANGYNTKFDTIGDIINNHAKSNNYAYGGAIREGHIIALNGVIKNNYAKGGSYVQGGALYNTKIEGGNVTEISGNYVEATGSAYGGAIYGDSNNTKLDTVGNILNNHAYTTGYNAQGGAIYYGNIGEINGSIKNNYAQAMGYAYGGAIYYVKIDEINCDIEDNYTAANGYAYGGAISDATIGVINGAVKNNHATSTAYVYGGALNNTKIDEFNGAIKGNYGEALVYDNDGNITAGGMVSGGALYYTTINGGVITEISGNRAEGYFTESQASNPYYGISGGAMHDSKFNSVLLKKISSNTAIGNGYASAKGGAISDGTYNSVLFEEISNNSAIATGNGNARGGAIYAASIGNNFDERQYVNVGTIVESKADGSTITFWLKSQKDQIESALAQGKKLYITEYTNNVTNITDEQWNDIQNKIADGTYILENPLNSVSEDDIWKIKGGLINTTIKNNYAKTNNAEKLAQGGAIYETNDFNIIADGSVDINNGIVTIQGNYVQAGDGEKDYQSIYMDKNTAVLGLEQLNGGKFYLYDNINGAEGYDVNIIGDGTGTMYLFNDIYNADITADNTNISLSNDEIHNYDLKKLTSNDNTLWNLDLDIDADSVVADTISTSDDSSTGVVTIGGLNFVTGSLDEFLALGDVVKVQILKNTANNSNLQLALAPDFESESETVLSESDVYNVDGITKDVNWSDNFDLINTHTTVTGILRLATTDTTNDSIGVKVTSVDEVNNLGTIDTLKAINQFETNEDRTFSAENSIDTYTVTDDLGETSAGKLTIQGIADVETRSTIDFDSHKGFELNNDNTELVLKDVEVKGSSALVTGDAADNVKVVLDNVNIHDNGDCISTYGDVEVKGNSTISDNITLSGIDSNMDIDGTDEVTLDSVLTGSDTTKLNISNGTVNLTDNAKVQAMDLNAQDVELNLAENSSLANINATFNGNNVVNIANENSLSGMNPTFNDITILNIANGKTGTLAFGDVNLNGLVKMQVDADLANKQMDKLSVISANVNGGSIEVDKINLLSKTTDTKTSLLFTDNTDLANVVSYIGEGTITYSPIYKYKTSYSVKDGQGYFDFVLPSNPGPSPEPAPSDFNPAVLASPVASQAGAQSAMNQAMYFSFEHGDTFMNNASADRFAMINNNTYALSTDYNENGERINYDHSNKAVWVKPYAVFENIPLKNGPKVDTISYGTLIGFDSDFHKMKKGWTNVGTAYIGYNGSQLKYSDVDTSTNGGMLGVTETFYKGNFWTAITASAGASVAEAHTMYGKDDMTSLMAGVGSKTGYNFEFAQGKFIVQPRIFLAYSMIKTFDYTNAAGVRIDSDPLHTIQINPAIKFIGNIKEWQPYASVGMNWNVMNQTKVTADGVRLPEMHTKPYVEYGVGVQKLWNNKYSAYAQAMVRNGGKNGIALSFGFRVALGKEGKPIEKVQKQTTNKVSMTSDIRRTTLKQLSVTQKAHLQKTTRTANVGVIK